MDGIDLAVIETDGKSLIKVGTTAFRPYEEDERDLIRKALVEARRVTLRSERTPGMYAAEEAVTRVHAFLVKTALHDAGLAAGDIDVIGFHGQIIFHVPDWHLTVQLGDARACCK